MVFNSFKTSLIDGVAVFGPRGELGRSILETLLRIGIAGLGTVRIGLRLEVERSGGGGGGGGGGLEATGAGLVDFGTGVLVQLRGIFNPGGGFAETAAMTIANCFFIISSSNSNAATLFISGTEPESGPRVEAVSS